MLNYIKRKFFSNIGNKDVPKNEQFFSPLRIALHSTIEVNTIDWFLIQSQLNESFKIPTGSFTVLAIGEILVQSDIIYQVYLMDNSGTEYMLQLYCNKNRQGKNEVSEVTLYQQVTMITPTTEEGWEENLSAVGFSTMELDGITYNRVWGDVNDNRVELMTFDENVVIPNADSVNYTNHFLLYGREIGNPAGEPVTEHLLIGVEEKADEASMTMQIGLTIPIQNVKIQ